MTRTNKQVIIKARDGQEVIGTLTSIDHDRGNGRLECRCTIGNINIKFKQQYNGDMIGHGRLPGQVYQMVKVVD